jgi:type I restriction enzyme S subunit
LIRPQPDAADGHFFFHQFISAPFQRLLERHTIQGATVNRIALKHFPTYPVMDPPPAVKAAFDATVAPAWARIHANQAQAQSLTALRDTLLPGLISGQLRLPQAEEAIAEATHAD